MSRPAFARGLLDRWRRRRINHRAVQEFSRSLALIVDREALEASVAVRIRELFSPDRLLLLRPDEMRSAFVPSLSFGLSDTDLEGAQISSGDKLARWLRVNETSLVLARQPEVFDYLDLQERSFLLRLGLSLCVPLLSLNRLTGILLLGADRVDWTVTRKDLELLGILAGQVSLALENADLYRAQRERLDRLHRAERLAAVGQLAAGIAHEIRNPLTAIRSTMQYLQKGFNPDEPKGELVAELLSEVDRINRTIGNLLNLSRSHELRFAALDLGETLDTVVTLVKAQAAEQGVEVVYDHPAELYVQGDSGALRQIFLNLLQNALEAMPGGGKLGVEIRFGAAQDVLVPTRWVEVAIRDTGPGIPEEQLRRIFDPFFTTKPEGTGLGLAISHGLVAQHQGEISFDRGNGNGKGTVVRVRLPLR